MKTILLSTLLFFCIGSLSYAQNMYFQVNGGYSFWVASDDLGSPLPEVGSTNFTQNADGTILEKPVYGTLLKGPSLGLAYGYMFNENLGIELAYYFARGSEFLDARIETPTYFAEQYSRSYGHTLSPSLVFTTGKKLLKGYSKVGIAVPVAGAIKTRAYVDDGEGIIGNRLPSPLPGATYKLDAAATSRALPALGFKGNLGLEYALTGRIAVFTDMTFTMLTLGAKNTTFDKFTVDVFIADQLALSLEADDLDPYYKEIIYQSQLTEQSNTELYNPDFDVTQALDELSFKSNGNNMTLAIGFKVYLGKMERDLLDMD